MVALFHPGVGLAADGRATWPVEHAVRLKVCGMRRRQDVLLAAELGADAIGLRVGQRHRCEDFLEPEEARKLAVACAPLMKPVLVTHCEQADPAVALAHELRVTTIQMHSECGVATLQRIRQALPGCGWLEPCMRRQRCDGADA